MPRTENEFERDYDDDWDADDPDAPQERDLDKGTGNDSVGGDDNADTPTEPCPSCGREVADTADKCPYCGDWIVPGAGGARRTPWFTLIVCLALAIVLAWAIMR